ncbi:hypothetical protein Bca101_000662 [Brassica carinata]
MPLPFAKVMQKGEHVAIWQLSPRGEEVSSILEYITKDKEKVCNENEGNKKRSYTSRRHSPLMSNPNFPDSIPDANTTDEDSDG